MLTYILSSMTRKQLTDSNAFTSIFSSLGFFVVFYFGFSFLRSPGGVPKFILTIIAILWGLGCLILLYTMLNNIQLLLPKALRKYTEPFLFVGPATLILSWYLLLPTLRTVYLSFLDRKAEAFVGLENYIDIFSNESMIISFTNNFLWLIFGTGFCVILGLIVAILSDRVRYERLVRAVIFMPLAISFVGAGIIWKFVYAYKPADIAQIGLFNGIVNFFGVDPINWLTWKPWNTFFLIIIFIWLQTGFAMVILSAAIKGVPKEIIEAARIDGVGEFGIILHIIIPSIKGTIITISTTILLLTLKIFDIVYTITNGLYGTEVLASQQFKAMFKFLHYGQGSALSVIIFVAVIPVMIYNLSRLNKGFK